MNDRIIFLRELEHELVPFLRTERERELIHFFSARSEY